MSTEKLPLHRGTTERGLELLTTTTTMLPNVVRVISMKYRLTRYLIYNTANNRVYEFGIEESEDGEEVIVWLTQLGCHEELIYARYVEGGEVVEEATIDAKIMSLDSREDSVINSVLDAIEKALEDSIVIAEHSETYTKDELKTTYVLASEWEGWYGE